MGKIIQDMKMVIPEIQMKRGAVEKEEGLFPLKYACATYEVGVDVATAGAHTLGVYIPDNAIILRAWYDVVTTFTSATDSATIKIGLVTQSDDCFVAAIAISDGTEPWNAGVHGTLIGTATLGADAAHDTALELAVLQAAATIKTTAERELVLTSAVDTLTAGKLNLFCEYIISD
jgi:hypothetical protein